MRPEFDGEIDSVLRGHARRGGARPAAWDAVARPSLSDGAKSVSHLDADEIAAFGEGALPAAARARYSAHLADCDDCRHSVTQVTLAAGVADRINEREAAGVADVAGHVAEHGRAAANATRSPSWRGRLSSIFAPRAWRYAMPVVALFALGAVVFVAMRGSLREGPLEVARRGGNAEQQQRAASAPAAPAAPEAHHADVRPPEPSATTEAQAGGAGARADARANEQGGEGAANDEVARLSAKSAGSADQSAPVVATTDAAGAQTEAVQVTRPEPARPGAGFVTAASPSPVPPPPPAAAPQTMIARDGLPLPSSAPTSSAEQATRARATGDSRAASVPRDEAPATKRHGPQRSGGGRAAESASAAPKDDRVALRRARGPANNAANNAANNRSNADESKAEREEDRGQQRAETRSVGGRQFRREGGVWIDTAYRPGQATVSVRRDSEQYRALVADEPEIGRISRALGGEAVIVWKGRAYRVKP